jgi:hypothetical protein
MFDSVALNVVIGLVFIYLLYSLLATVISEMIAVTLALRARNLKEAVERMLTDEKDAGLGERIWSSFRLMKTSSAAVVDEFYKQPEIKYLGSSGIFKNPSSFKAVSFSKTLMHMLFGDGPYTPEEMEARLKSKLKIARWNDDKEKKLSPEEQEEKDKERLVLDRETIEYIHSIWVESYGDITKFRLQLEGWFDRTMEQATEWYKRKIQIVLLILGFCMAWFFNADSFAIIRKLSTDKDAREKMVSMANAYVQNNPKLPIPETSDSAIYKTAQQKLDTLLEVKKKLDQDLENAHEVLGMGGWLPDEVKIVRDSAKAIVKYVPQIDPRALSCMDRTTNADSINFDFWAKMGYLKRLLLFHFWGFLLTAFAISLGAPFWFDLLNKLMRLRTSQKQETTTPSNSAGNGGGVSPLNREA